MPQPLYRSNIGITGKSLGLITIVAIYSPNMYLAIHLGWIRNQVVLFDLMYEAKELTGVDRYGA